MTTTLDRDRSILMALVRVRALLRSHGGNPYHVASGEKGGQFTSGPKSDRVQVGSKLTLKSFERQPAAYREGVEAAIRMIEQTHLIPGSMPGIPVRLLPSRSGLSGQYVASARVETVPATEDRRAYSKLVGMPLPKSIDVFKVSTRDVSSLDETTVHEFGHYLDHIGIPGGEDQKRDHKSDPRFREWHETVAASPTIQRFEAERSNLESGKSGQHLNEKDREEFLRSHNYLLRSNEVWARAYMQYVLSKNGRQPKNAADQWPADEFKPIAAAMDRMFEQLGWTVHGR